MPEPVKLQLLPGGRAAAAPEPPRPAAWGDRTPEEVADLIERWEAVRYHVQVGALVAAFCMGVTLAGLAVIYELSQAFAR